MGHEVSSMERKDASPEVEGGEQAEGGDSNGGQEAADGGGLRKPRMTKRTTTAVGAIVVAILLISTAWMLSSDSSREVTIVAILPLTGTSSYLVEIEDAMALVVEELNRWGGINGMRIRLVVEDCASSPEMAVERLVEAEERYHPLAVLTATRGAATPMSAIAEEKGVLLISIGATGEELTADKDWIFRYYVSPSGEADNALQVLDTLNVSSLGILHLDDAYGNPIANQLAEGFQSVGGAVTSYDFEANRTEFSDGVDSVMETEAVFAVALRHQFPAILEELNASGYPGHVICAVEASIPDMWGLQAAQGCYVSAPIMYGSGATVDTEFLTDFEDRFGRQLTHQGAIGADAIRLIWGLLSDTDVTRETLKNLLNAGYVHSGILGVVTVDQGVHNADVAVYPALIEEGELKYL